MAKPKSRDEVKTYGRSPIGVRLPLMMEIRLRTEAQTRGKKISDLIRQALSEKWGSGGQCKGDSSGG